jgi:predicted adenylyl cyclase CyaB
VRKRREIFVHENVRIHIDRVEELGEFVELEALYDGSPAAEVEQRRLIDYLMKELGIEQSDLLATSYEGMIDA